MYIMNARFNSNASEMVFSMVKATVGAIQRATIGMMLMEPTWFLLQLNFDAFCFEFSPFIAPFHGHFNFDDAPRHAEYLRVILEKRL